MADIRRLDGTALDVAKPARNERIARILDELTEMNDSGHLSALLAVTITPDTIHQVHWAIPEQDFGYPWGLALRGALVLAQHAIGNADIIACPEHQEPVA